MKKNIEPAIHGVPGREDRLALSSKLENPHHLTSQIRFELTRNRLGNQLFSWSATIGFRWSVSPDFPPFVE